MIPFIEHWVSTFWLAFTILWVVAAFTSKRSVQVQSGGSRFLQAGLVLMTLGRNWSGLVTIKQDHELIQRGPYQLVRHPIYTGMLVGMLGTAFIYGIARCFVGVLAVGLAFWLTMQIEERFMLQQFGAQYADYRQHVRALIPFVL